MPRIQLTDYEAFYQQDGQGPDVVLIHGFTSNQSMWLFSGIASALRERFRVTSYDLRGHGASSAPVSGYTSKHLAHDLAELHDRLDLGPAWLVGHSLGGAVAMHEAVLHPEKVAGIVLSDTYFPGLAHLEPDMSHVEIWRNLHVHFAEVGHDIGERVDFRRLLNVVAVLGAAEQAALREKLGPPAVRWLSQLRPLAATSAAEEAFDPAGLTAEALASVRQPVVALYDERTPFEATWNWLQQHLPDCRAERVPGAAHLALLENPEVFTELVLKYLVSLSAQVGPVGESATARVQR